MPGVDVRNPGFIPGVKIGFADRNPQPSWWDDTGSAIVYIEYDQFESDVDLPKLMFPYMGRQVEADAGCGENGILLEKEGVAEEHILLRAELLPLMSESKPFLLHKKGLEVDTIGKMPLLQKKARQCCGTLDRRPHRRCRNRIVSLVEFPRCRHHPEQKSKSCFDS